MGIFNKKNNNKVSIDKDNLSEMVNELFKQAHNNFKGTRIEGYRHIDLNDFMPKIQFKSDDFTVNHSSYGLDFLGNEVPPQISQSEDIAFRVEIKTKKKQKKTKKKHPGKYLAIMWVSKGSPNHYVAYYATNDEDYVEHHKRLYEVRSRESRKGAGGWITWEQVS